MKIAWVYTENYNYRIKGDIEIIKNESTWDIGIVNNGILIPVEFDDSVIDPRFAKSLETNGIFSIIEDAEKKATHDGQIKAIKNGVKMDKAKEVIIHVNGIIEDWPIADKITLLGRSDIQLIMTFLNYGSINQSRDLCASLVADSLITEEIKSNILNFLDLKIAEFNSMVF